MEDSDDNPEGVTPEDFVRYVTLDEHFRHDQELVARGIIKQAMLDSLRAEYEAREQPGDQWYEWQRGTEPMMGYGGMALVRNGIVVWASQSWIS